MKRLKYNIMKIERLLKKKGWEVEGMCSYISPYSYIDYDLFQAIQIEGIDLKKVKK